MSVVAITKKLLRPLKVRASLAIERLLGYPKEKARFLSKQGYSLNLKHPITFNEKLERKKLYDRSALLTLTSDKYLVRDYVRKKLGDAMGEEILIPLLHVSENPSDIPFSLLPSSYAAKANHGSGWNLLVRNGNISNQEIVTACSYWLSTPYGNRTHAWAYQRIPRRVVFEKLILDEHGEIPKDFKFFMFHGKCRLIQVDSNRFDGHTRRLYTPEWTALTASYKYPVGPATPAPPNLAKMIQIAEKLSEDFDFVRVDLYSIGEKVFFGELTHYPEGGTGKFSPHELDVELGSYWK